jgi:hypothetical protein
MQTKAGYFFDRIILFHEVCAFPPFRQKKGERMGHGAGCVSPNSATVKLVQIHTVRNLAQLDNHYIAGGAVSLGPLKAICS